MTRRKKRMFRKKNKTDLLGQWVKLVQDEKDPHLYHIVIRRRELYPVGYMKFIDNCFGGYEVAIQTFVRTDIDQEANAKNKDYIDEIIKRETKKLGKMVDEP